MSNHDWRRSLYICGLEPSKAAQRPLPLAIILVFFILQLGSTLGAGMHPSFAPPIPRPRPSWDQKQLHAIKQTNSTERPFTLGIVAAEPLSSELTVAYEMSLALLQGQETGPHGERALRLMAMVGDDGRQNITDVIRTPGVDLAIVPVLLLNRVRESKELDATKLVYVTQLFPAEVHILAGQGIGSIQELTGHEVNLGEVGSAGAVLGRDVFDRLRIRINEVNVPLTSALDSMRRGQLSATVLVSGKPARSVAEIRRDGGLHLLALPHSAALEQDYLPASLQHEDYPELIPRGTTLETISSNSVLITYNWPAESERYHLLEALVSTLFPRVRELQPPLNTPKWREVNLDAPLSTWQRFRPAQEWVEQHPALTPKLQREFEQFLDKNESIPMEHERLFRDFLRWHKQHVGN